MHEYYAARQQQMLDAFGRNVQGFGEALAQRLGEDGTAGALADARVEYERIVPEIPYIGGDENPLTSNLVACAELLALYRSLAKRGMSARDVGRLVYEVADANLSGGPASIRMGEKAFARFCEDRRRGALMSQRREYPGDWLYTTRDADGDSDFSIDYTECAIEKFFRTQGAAELTPYLCLLDFPSSRAMGSGLQRLHTIADGDGVCDFRFKRGRPVTQGWAEK
jgi:hypothetical protein